MGFKKAYTIKLTVENVAFDSCDDWVLYQNVDEGFVVDNYYVWIQTRKVQEKMDFILGKVNALKPISAEEEYEDAIERVFESTTIICCLLTEFTENDRGCECFKKSDKIAVKI